MRIPAVIRRVLMATALCCVATQFVGQTPNESGVHASQLAPKRQGFFDYALGRVNPHDTDYGSRMVSARSAVVGHTIDDLYFWSNVVTLLLLCGLAAIVLFQWRAMNRRELIAASLIAQLWNGRVSDRVEIERRTEQFNQLVEAQAFKRASSCFGLGRYLYNLPETWVALDNQGRPIKLPTLPGWALPKANQANGNANPACGPQPPALHRGPIDHRTTTKIEGFRRILGDALYGEILWRIGHVRRASDIATAHSQANVAEAMQRASRGIEKANSLAEQVGETSFIAVMDKLRIESTTTIPGIESLKLLVAELELEATRSVA